MIDFSIFEIKKINLNIFLIWLSKVLIIDYLQKNIFLSIEINFIVKKYFLL